ncbi:MAG: TolC family protein [Chromatiaceae bacterium]|nr:TolC family protein [Gammaproteobacteria bacterium]MCP5414232.1 TolC family protein [Chromatiaceae bacterium]MCW5587161.1 TolC family protein [Chromatiales bacterium]MCB1818989.1 TolC family protein [Gammaproteobacteria bacterium]MCP5434335.1 TolC family protein [Chromatiaceae bacterium]
MRIDFQAARVIRRAAATFFVWVLAVGYPALSAADAPANPQLSNWVRHALAESPDVQAAQAAVDAAQARLAGAGRPLNNPELEIEYERSDIDFATVGVSQTLDWHDKQGARQRIADASLVTTRTELTAARERIASELLAALAAYQAGQTQVELAERQTTLLQRFSELAQRRGHAGDLGTTEVQLAQLARVEGEIAAAGHQVALAEAHDALTRLTGTSRIPDVALPVVPAENLPVAGSAHDLAQRSPEVRVAQAQAQAANLSVRGADLDRRADPTIGIKGGKEDNQSLFGLNLSIPLQMRNDFSAEVAAVRSESTMAAHRLAQAERGARAQIESAQRRYRALRQAWQVWERAGESRLQQRLELLEKLWRVGELPTTDYLVQVQQTLDTESASLTLRRDLWQSWIAWLRAAGQVTQWLGLDSQGDE